MGRYCSVVVAAVVPLSGRHRGRGLGKNNVSENGTACRATIFLTPGQETMLLKAVLPRDVREVN
jgi:hypothetical protein